MTKEEKEKLTTNKIEKNKKIKKPNYIYRLRQQRKAK